MTDFVAELAALDFAAIDTALARGRDAIEQGQQLSLGDLNPTALLGDLGTAMANVNDLHLDADQLTALGRSALDSLAALIDLPDLSGIEQIVAGFDELAGRLSGLAAVFAGGGDGRAVLDRVLRELSGSLDLDALIREVTDNAVRVLGVTIPEEFRAPLDSLAALAGNPSPDELVQIIGSVVTGLDIAGVGRLVGSAEGALTLVAGAGDAGPLAAAVAAVDLRLAAAHALLGGASIDVDALLAAIDDIGAAVDLVGTALPAFSAGLATDLRTASNTLAELDLVPALDGLVAELPLPGEDIPQQLVDSLDGMAAFFEQLTGPALADALVAMRDEVLGMAGLDQLAGLLAGMDEMFDEVGAQLDRLPVRALRDEAVAALVAAQQEVLAFDGFDFLGAAVAPIRELETTIRTLDLSTVTDAVAGLAAQVDGLLEDVDLAPLRDAVDAVVEPLGDIVEQLVPFVQQVAEQLGQLVDELNAIDFDVAGTATLDLLHGIRTQVTDAVAGGDVPEPVKAVVAGAAAVLRELDLAAEITKPFDKAVVSIDMGALIAPIEEVWTVAGDTLRKATPEALIAELDPPFEQLVAAVDQLSLQPLIDAVQGLFDDLIGALQALDPRTLVAPLEGRFQELVSTLTSAIDPAPLFAPLRAAHEALLSLLRQLDVSAMLNGVLGGLADMPQQIAGGVGERLRAQAPGTLPVPTAVAGFKLGDILRPLALFLQEVRGRLAALAAGTLGPVLAEFAAATRGLRALVDPVTGFAVRVGDALDARLAWLDPHAGDGPLARLRTDLESLQMAVLALDVDAGARARLTASAAGVQFDVRVSVTVDADLEQHSGQVRAASGAGEVGRSTRVLARALDAALPAELLTGGLDPVAATDAFLDAVFARIDPTDLADQLDAIGDRIEARFLALGDELALGLFRLFDSLFASIEPLMPANVITRLQAGIDRVLARLDVLDPAPIEDEVRAVIDAAISLLAVHSPAALAAELGAVFDACLDQVRTLSPAALFAGLDPFAPVKEQLAELRPSTVLAPLVTSTAGFGTALDTIASIDLSFATGIVDELKAAFATVLAAVEQEWNALLDELAQISGSASASVG